MYDGAYRVLVRYNVNFVCCICCRVYLELKENLLHVWTTDSCGHHCLRPEPLPRACPSVCLGASETSSYCNSASWMDGKRL